jgi:predicted nuclease of restriction endonuclease-like (RecB) superfamily
MSPTQPPHKANKLKPATNIPATSTVDSPLLGDIRQVVEQARGRIQQQVNSAMVEAYWHIGRLIVEHEQKGEQRADYGKQQLQQLATKLTAEFGKGFDQRNLRNMRAFYQAFPIWNAVRTELSWTHYRYLIAIENHQARQWYLQESITQNWSARTLDRQIGVLYYERLLSSQDKAAVMQEAQGHALALANNPKDFLRDPYVLDFLDLGSNRYQESDLEQGLINNLQQFLLELGKGFAFVARQQRISTEDQDFYVDLVFYNFKLKCFLLIDIKVGKLTHQDVGQMDTYIRIYDQHQKGEDDGPTIGLILCSQKSEAVVKYSVLTDSAQMFAAKYLAYLPSEVELKQALERERIWLQQKLTNQNNDD